MMDEIRTSYPHQPYRYEAGPGDYTVAGDAKLLQQILNNLLSNAARYSPDKRLVKVTLSRERESLVLRVVDQGIGIKPEDLPTVFEPFKRGGNVGSISGTGLGLSIVKHRRRTAAHRGRSASGTARRSRCAAPRPNRSGAGPPAAE